MGFIFPTCGRSLSAPSTVIIRMDVNHLVLIIEWHDKERQVCTALAGIALPPEKGSSDKLDWN